MRRLVPPSLPPKPMETPHTLRLLHVLERRPKVFGSTRDWMVTVHAFLPFLREIADSACESCKPGALGPSAFTLAEADDTARALLRGVRCDACGGTLADDGHNEDGGCVVGDR